MKSRIILSLLAFLFVASIAAAQTRPEAPSLGKPVGGPPVAGLNLTDEQKAKMTDLRVKHLKEIESLKAELQKQHSALKLELTADKFNESKVKGIQSEISKLQSDLGWKKIQHLRSVREILTAEQQKKFDAGVLTGRGPGRGNQKGMGRGMGMGPGAGPGPGAGMGMHRGMGMGHGPCPCCSGDNAPAKQEPKK